MLQPYIWRNVLTQSLYQSLVILILAYFGVFMFFDETFNLIASNLRDENGNPENIVVLDTIIFHTFVLMNLFNMINCRVITPEDNINIFSTLCNNLYFFIIFGIEMALQNWMIILAEQSLGSAMLGLAPLTRNQ